MPPTTSRRPGRASSVRHRLLLIALILVVLFHGSLLLAGSYQRTYDAYVHIFFADHYRAELVLQLGRPLVHRLLDAELPARRPLAIAACQQDRRAADRRSSLVQTRARCCNLTVGVYRWARIWVDQTAAGWAAILLVLSSSIAETVHVFGQLPTTFSLGFLLNSLPFAHRWFRRPAAREALLAGIACTMATTAGHHVTTLFGAVFFLGPVLVFGDRGGAADAAAGRARRAPGQDRPAAALAADRPPAAPGRCRRSVRAGLYGGCW